MDGDFLHTFTFLFRDIRVEPDLLITVLETDSAATLMPGLYTLQVLSYGISCRDLLCVGEFVPARTADAVPLTKPVIDNYMYAFHQAMCQAGKAEYCESIEMFSFDTMTEKAYRHYTPPLLLCPAPAPPPIDVQAFDPDAF